MACIQRTRELVLNYKPIRNYLKNMISIIEQGVLDKEQTALWSVRILRQAELINMPIEELNFAVFTCKRYISEDDSEPFRCAEAAYALALILFNNSPLESQTYLSRARNYIETAIRADNNAEWIALYYNIICFDLFMAKCKSQDTKALNDEKIKCLQLLLAISPTFTYADDFLLNEKKHCKTTDKCAEIDSETHIFASRLRKKLSQGQIPAEQKIINKFLLIVAITLSSLFLFIMPIFFSIFRGYVGLILINNSIYLVFMRFYIPAAIETLFNMFAGFTFYGIIRRQKALVQARLHISCNYYSYFYCPCNRLELFRQCSLKKQIFLSFCRPPIFIVIIHANRSRYIDFEYNYGLYRYWKTFA